MHKGVNYQTIIHKRLLYSHMGGFEDHCLKNKNVSVITNILKYLSLDAAYFF